MQNLPTRKTPFSFHLDEEVLTKIKRIAKSENRSTSNLLEYLCKECIRKYEENYGQIHTDDF